MRTDVELLKAWRGGDEPAGNELVRRHFGTLHRFFYGKAVGHVDDLLQRTFLAAVEGREKIIETSGFRAFLLGIARRQLLLFYREQRRDGKSTAFVSGLVAADKTSPTENLRLADEQRLMIRALRRIPVDFQIALELYYWEGMSTAEIAAVLDVAQGTVKSRLGRARDMIRKEIAGMEASPAVQSSIVADFDRWARSLRAALHPDADDRE